MPIIDELISHCDPGDRSTFKKYFATLNYAFDLVDKTSTTEKGFRNGVWPPCPRRIMEMCPAQWNKLNHDEQNIVLSGIRLVAHQIAGSEFVTNLHDNADVGYVEGVADDHLMESLFSVYFGPIKNGPNDEVQGGKRKKSDLGLNQWRATRIFAPGVRQTYLNRLMVKAGKIAEAARVADEKAKVLHDKIVYSLSPQGIAEADEKRRKIEIAAQKRLVKEIWIADPNNIGKTYVAQRAPPKQKLANVQRVFACSYCAREWLPLCIMPWSKCNAFTHDKCEYRCCGSDVCNRQHQVHMS